VCDAASTQDRGINTAHRLDLQNSTGTCCMIDTVVVDNNHYNSVLYLNIINTVHYVVFC